MKAILYSLLIFVGDLQGMRSNLPKLFVFSSNYGLHLGGSELFSILVHSLHQSKSLRSEIYLGVMDEKKED